jgi:hypothetical protein
MAGGTLRPGAGRAEGGRTEQRFSREADAPNFGKGLGSGR